MGIEVNGKKFGFNLDVRLGILELMDRADKLDVKHIKIILKEILRPIPTGKDLFNVRRSDIENIMEAFIKKMEIESAEYKKKLSS